MRTEFETEQRPDISTFFKAKIEDKKKILSSFGIVLGTEHIGTVTADGNRAVINGLINPFNGEKLEACFSNEEICLTEGDKVAVRLQVMKVKRGIKGLKPSPENIFVLEYICRFNEDADGKIELLEGEIEKYQEKIKVKNSLIAQLREQNKEYRNKADDIYIKELESKMKNLAQDFREQLEENRRIADIIIERGITTLVHVTHVDNLESILERGILPRDTVPEGAVTIDSNRSEGKRNCNCLSVERPNNRYISQNASKYGGRKNFVCLCIKPTILLDGKTKHYCPYNAATNTVTNKIYRGELTTSKSFQDMFADHINEWGPYAGTIDEDRAQDELPSRPTSIQAEILYEGIIKPEEIISVDFPSEKALEESQNLLNKYGVNGTVCKRLNF